MKEPFEGHVKKKKKDKSNAHSIWLPGRPVVYLQGK